MAKVWCICFDLLDEPMPDSAPGIRELMRPVFPTIPEKLHTLGPSIPLTSSACLLAADLSADQIMEHLHSQVLNERERIVILPVDSSAIWRIHSGSADDAVIAWIAHHLQPTGKAEE